MEDYNKLCGLLQTQLGYELLEEGKNDDGKNYWVFKKNAVGKKVNENDLWFFYMGHEKRWEDMMEEANRKFIETLKDKPLRFD